MESTGWRGVRRFVAYAAATLIPVVWLGVVLAQTFTTEIDRAALHQAQGQADSIVSSTIEPFLRGQPFDVGMTSQERRDIQMTTEQLLRQDTLLELRLRDTTGRIVFDGANPTAPAGPPVLLPDAQRAVETGIVIHLTEVTVADGRVQAVKAFVPLQAGNRALVVGVAELTFPYGAIAADRQASVDRLLFTIIVGLSVLWLVLAVIVVSVGLRVRRQSDRAEFMALHDSLTGLPGRALYADRVEAALAASGRMGTDVALVVVDLDRFKEVNDTLGHRNGDELLRMIAARMHQALRPGDTVARLGGDEFGVVLPGARAETVEMILRRLQVAVEQEAELGGVAVSIEASMGYAMWPADADNADSLVQRADLALYAAKTARAAIVRYHAGIDEFDPKRLGLIAELRRGIGAGDLVLHYQPKIDSASGNVVAFEALVRWMHPTRGMVPPNDFIPIAESTGLIGPLTHWVLDTALAQLAEWSRSQPELSMAVNISARNLRDDLPGWVLNRVAAHGVRPSQVVLEITETSFAADPVRATALLEELSAAGVKVSLDDFGQGYTSLGSLGHLPVCELKIDRGFVLAMGTSAEDRAIVASVIELGHQLGLTVVAEGVETEAVRADLCSLGCDTMQGFLFSPPVPAAAALGLVDRLHAPV
jgi:diguanylate cyclase (GGDEF)-like protein